MAKLINTLDQEIEILNNPLLHQTYPNIHIKLDTFIIYLRKVHAYDYFTSTIHENYRILSLKIGSAFLRMETNSTIHNEIY